MRLNFGFREIMVADDRFAFHEESSGFVPEKPDRVFAALDDHKRLAAHMSKPSWRMGWATMQIIVEPGRPRGVGSHIALRGRVFGFRLSLNEIVTRYEPPSLKEWQTTEPPRLLVIGNYRMGFRTSPERDGTLLTVTIDYDPPTSIFSRILAGLFGRVYLRWCTRQMVTDAIQTAAGTS